MISNEKFIEQFKALEYSKNFKEILDESLPILTDREFEIICSAEFKS